MKYPALVEKSNLLKKAVSVLVYPINFLIGWTGFSFYLPTFNQREKGLEERVSKLRQLDKDKKSLKRDRVVLKKVYTFVCELSSTQHLTEVLKKAYVGQTNILRKSHPYLAAS